MGKQKKSKHRNSSSQSSSRRSRSLSNRSSSLQSYKHRSKKNKHKQDKKRKHESKKDKKNKKQQKRQDRKQPHRQRQMQRQSYRPVKLQQPIQHMDQLYSNSLIKQEKIQAQKIEHQQEQNIINQAQERFNVRNNNNPQILQQQDNKPKKQEPNFQPSGILLEYYNSRQGVSLRFHQPPQARQPQQQWRMYIFKDEQVLKPIQLTKSSYLIGKDDRVVDILAQNPSISRQHCVIQFRLIQKRQTQGDYLQTIKPYIMDLQSTNGTLLNDQKIQSGRYYELLHRDVLKFGFSDRQYVIVRWEENQQSQQNNDDDEN